MGKSGRTRAHTRSRQEQVGEKGRGTRSKAIRRQRGYGKGTDADEMKGASRVYVYNNDESFAGSLQRRPARRRQDAAESRRGRRAMICSSCQEHSTIMGQHTAPQLALRSIASWQQAPARPSGLCLQRLVMREERRSPDEPASHEALNGEQVGALHSRAWRGSRMRAGAHLYHIGPVKTSNMACAT